MTDRLPVHTINSDQLDALIAERDGAYREAPQAAGRRPGPPRPAAPRRRPRPPTLAIQRTPHRAAHRPVTPPRRWAWTSTTAW